MDVSEVTTHSFIVKIWVEELAGASGHAVWRGYVTHVPDGKRYYLRDLDDLTAFIAPYIERMGGQVGACLRIRRWLYY